MLQRGVFSLGREVSRALRVKDGPLQTHRVPGGEVGTEPCCPASASCPGWLQALGAPHMSAPHFLSGRALQSENPVHWPGALTWDSAVLWPCRNFSRVSHLLFNLTFLLNFGGAFPGGAVLNNPPANAEDLGSIRGSGRSPGGGNGSSTPVFLPRESHGQRSPWGHKESGMTE